jgi:hypothetical protein
MYGRGGACHCWHGRGPKASSCDSFVLVAVSTRWRSMTVGRSSSGSCGGLWRCRARRVSPVQKNGVCRREERLWRSCGDGACKGGRVRSGGCSGGHGDEDDDGCRISDNGKSRLGGGVVWRRRWRTDAPVWRDARWCRGLGGVCWNKPRYVRSWCVRLHASVHARVCIESVLARSSMFGDEGWNMHVCQVYGQTGDWFLWRAMSHGPSLWSRWRSILGSTRTRQSCGVIMNSYMHRSMQKLRY